MDGIRVGFPDKHATGSAVSHFVTCRKDDDLVGIVVIEKKVNKIGKLAMPDTRSKVCSPTVAYHQRLA